MIAAPRTWIKNIAVALTLGVAAIATWAVTDSQAPALGAGAGISRNV